MFMNGAIAWDVHFQETVALSSVQAELVALSDGSRDLRQAKYLFDELNASTWGDNALCIYCDSAGAIQNGKHPIGSRKLRQVPTKEFDIRDCVRSRILKIVKIDGTKNPADLGTKYLARKKFEIYNSFCLNQKLETDYNHEKGSVAEQAGDVAATGS